MHVAFRNAFHDLFGVWRETRLIVLVAQTAAIYAAVLIPFKVGIPLIPGFAELRPANALPIVASLLFGPAAAWGAGFGNVIGDCFGTLSPVSLFGFAGNFLYGYVPYLLWGRLGPLSSGRGPDLRSWRQWLEFVMVCAVASLVCAAVIGWGAALMKLVPFRVLTTAIFFNNLIMALLLAPPLLLFLGPRVRRWGLRYKNITTTTGREASGKGPGEDRDSDAPFVDIRAVSFTYRGSPAPALRANGDEPLPSKMILVGSSFLHKWAVSEELMPTFTMRLGLGGPGRHRPDDVLAAGGTPSHPPLFGPPSPLPQRGEGELRVVMNKYFLYVPRDTWLHRLDPRSKILAVLGLFAIALAFSDPRYLIVPTLIVFLLLAAAHALSNVAKIWILLVLLLLYGMGLWPFFVSGRTPFLTIGGYPVTMEAAGFGMGMGLRVNLMLLSGLFLLSTTTIEAFMLALQRLGLPAPASFALSLAFRWVPSLLGSAAPLYRRNARGAWTSPRAACSPACVATRPSWSRSSATSFGRRGCSPWRWNRRASVRRSGATGWSSSGCGPPIGPCCWAWPPPSPCASGFAGRDTDILM